MPAPTRLPSHAPVTLSSNMSTLTKSRAKKPARAVRKAPAAKLPPGMEISPITGLAVVAARKDLPPLTSEAVRAMLANLP